MDDQEKKQQKSILNLLENISKSMKWFIMTAVFGFIFALISNANEVVEFAHNFKDVFSDELKITGRFNPSGTVAYGTTVAFNYSVPESGYYSIWNQNSKGELIRIQPLSATSAMATGLKYSYPLMPSTSDSNETVIILWSDNANHPDKQKYRTQREFDEFINTHNNQTWKKKSFSLQVQ